MVWKFQSLGKKMYTKPLTNKPEGSGFNLNKLFLNIAYIVLCLDSNNTIGQYITKLISADYGNMYLG